jgi:hypothetical protein
MMCNCCVFKAIQSCNLLHRKPFRNVYWDEKLINIQHIENDLKVYDFYRKVFERINELQIEMTPSLFSGDRIQKFTRYYIYCYEHVPEQSVIFYLLKNMDKYTSCEKNVHKCKIS